MKQKGKQQKQLSATVLLLCFLFALLPTTVLAADAAPTKYYFHGTEENAFYGGSEGAVGVFVDGVGDYTLSEDTDFLFVNRASVDARGRDIIEFFLAGNASLQMDNITFSATDAIGMPYTSNANADVGAFIADDSPARMVNATLTGIYEGDGAFHDISIHAGTTWSVPTCLTVKGSLSVEGDGRLIGNDCAELLLCKSASDAATVSGLTLYQYQSEEDGIVAISDLSAFMEGFTNYDEYGNRWVCFQYLPDENQWVYGLPDETVDYTLVLSEGKGYQNRKGVNEVDLSALHIGSDRVGSDHIYIFDAVSFVTTAPVAMKIEDANATIDLVNDSINVIVSGNSASANTCGLFAEGSVSFVGDGSFMAFAGKSSYESIGIKTNGAFTVNSGNIEGNSGEADAGNSYGIYAQGAFTVNGGDVTGNAITAESNSYGIYTLADLLVNGGNATGNGGNAQEKSYGVYVDASFTVNGGSVVATGDPNLESSFGAGVCSAFTITGGDVTLSGSTLASAGWDKSTYAWVPNAPKTQDENGVNTMHVLASANTDGTNWATVTSWVGDGSDNVGSYRGMHFSPEVAEKIEYRIPGGANQTVYQGHEAVFRSDADYSKFVKVTMDGKDVDKDNYTVTEGSTVVKLKADYTKTLSAGKHTLTIVSTDGTASTSFTVKTSSDGSGSTATGSTGGDIASPKTADESSVLLWSMLLFISSIGIAIVTVNDRKNRNHGILR